MASKKPKLPPFLDREAVKERQKELRALAEAGAPGLMDAHGDGGCTWTPFDEIVIGPNGVEHRIVWRCV